MPIDHFDHNNASPSTTDVPTASTSAPSSAIDGAILDGTNLLLDGPAPLNFFPGLTLQPPPSLGPKQPRRPSPPPEPEVLVKRQRNNAAAKKYRQKKVDRIKELEDEVEEVKRERDDLRIRLARQEAEASALREMLKLGASGIMRDR